MKRVFVILSICFILVSCSGQNPTNPSQRNTYELIAKNPHYPPTFNIFINEEFVGFIDADKDSGVIKNMGKFFETESTHFQSFFADSPFSLLDDTTISTLNCDSVELIIGCVLLAYYED